MYKIPQTFEQCPAIFEDACIFNQEKNQSNLYSVKTHLKTKSKANGVVAISMIVLVYFWQLLHEQHHSSLTPVFVHDQYKKMEFSQSIKFYGSTLHKSKEKCSTKCFT